MFFAHGFDKDSKFSRISLWQQVEKSTGKAPEALLNKPECPELLGHLWDMYIEIKNGCTEVSWNDLSAYQNIMGVDISPDEALLMIRLDTMRRSNGN